jgi:enoyl-CoA hydratase/carnithine racemase
MRYEVREHVARVTIDRETKRNALSQLATRSPGAIRLGRPAFYRALDQTSARALPELQAILSVATTFPDAAEGVAAFQEKRSPTWPT